MAAGAFKGGVVEINFWGDSLKLTGTAETVHQASQDGKLVREEVVRSLTQLAMSSHTGEYYDKARGLKVKVRDRGYVDIVHKRADDTMRRKMAEHLFLAGWRNIGYYQIHDPTSRFITVDRWGMKPSWNNVV